MITGAFLSLVSTVITGIDALLPGITMPSWLSAGNLIPSDVSNFIGDALHILAPFFPSAILAEIFVGICSLWPFVAAYTVAQWVYCHIPEVAGFGTGGGC